MMEVEHAAGGGADLLMECDEEEQEIWPPSPETHGEEDQGLEAVVSPMEQETDPPPVRIIPIPVQPVSSCSPSTVKHSVKPSGGPLGFMVNGRVVPLLPGGGGVELKLHSHPKGSASGFTTVQIPVTVTVHSPAGTHHINTTASLTAAITQNPAATAPPEPEAGPTPIITGVVSGEAAQKVLSDHNVNFKSSPPLLDLKTSPTLPLNSRRTTPPASQRTKPPPSSSRPAAPHKLLRKGLSHVTEAEVRCLYRSSGVTLSGRRSCRCGQMFVSQLSHTQQDQSDQVLISHSDQDQSDQDHSNQV